MKKNISMAVCFCLFFSGCAMTLDKRGNPTRPDPAVTLSSGLIIPGGGWFYMGNQGGGKETDFGTGTIYFLSTAGAIVFGAVGVKNGNGAQSGIGFGLAFLLRAFDMNFSTRRAFDRNQSENPTK